MMICPRCNVEMTIGQAIKTDGPSCQYFIRAFDNTIKAEDVELIACYKCPKCGHSDDGKDE